MLYGNCSCSIPLLHINDHIILFFPFSSPPQPPHPLPSPSQKQTQTRLSADSQEPADLQVSALLALPGGGVPATYLSSQQSMVQKKAVFRELNLPVPSCKLLYVTPEQLVKSTVLVEILQRLDERGQLACLVVDEVVFSPHVPPYQKICKVNIIRDVCLCKGGGGG